MGDQNLDAKTGPIHSFSNEELLSAQVSALREAEAHHGRTNNPAQAHVQPGHPSDHSSSSAEAHLPKIILRATHPGHGNALDDFFLKLQMQNEVRAGHFQVK